MPQAKTPAATRVNVRPPAKSAPQKTTWPAEQPPLATPIVDVTLTAAIIAVMKDEPMVAVLMPKGAFPPDLGASGARRFGAHLDALPSERFDPKASANLDAALRSCIQHSTALDIGYLEQLYTFNAPIESDDTASADLSIGYLALAHAQPAGEATSTGLVWQSCYRFFPWEDWRRGKPGLLSETIEPRLLAWAGVPSADNPRHDQLRICFGIGSGNWDEERVLERYELMLAAGLLDEAHPRNTERKSDSESRTFGVALSHDHRRILATALGRLRSKIKYRPVVFELMPPEFTLFELQRTVEAILGPHLHKQNFRRLVENMGLVEPTGIVKTHTGGRPAKLFRFRRDVLLERPSPGVRVRVSRN
jgi:hypothetical protein